MDKKFEAVIDLEAQPFTDAVRTAIAGLQTLAAELEKANSSLNTMADGAANSAAGADSVTVASTEAAAALGNEADAAKAAAKANEQHADAAKKSAAATAQSAAENKRMREGLMVGATMMRIGASLAQSTGNDKTASALDMGGSVLNAFAMRAMMGNAGLAIGLGEVTAKSFGFFDDLILGGDRKAGTQKAAAIGDQAKAREIQTLIAESTKYTDVLRIRKKLEDDLANANVALQQVKAKNVYGDFNEEKAAITRQIEMISGLLKQAREKEPGSLEAENKQTLAAYNEIRQKALGGQAFQLDLINADSEKDKIAVIEAEITRLRMEGVAVEAAARAMIKTGDPEEVKRKLNEVLEIRSQADSLELQLAGMGKDKSSGTSLPGQTYAGPDVDALAKRGMFLGGSIGSVAASGDYARRSATAAEKTAQNTERLLAKLDQNTATATWGG